MLENQIEFIIAFLFLLFLTSIVAVVLFIIERLNKQRIKKNYPKLLKTNIDSKL